MIAASLSSCYEDLGNYDYKEINEIEVEGIDQLYARDVDDSLRIHPKILGTLYNDTSKFSYEWEIANKIYSTTHNLEIIVNMLPGSKISRFIVKDKETGIKKYHEFRLNVSSSTAGDLIMILSKYQGKAEMSYLRLDKPANFAVNYFEERFGYLLGSNPKQLHILYPEFAKYPFTNAFGRLMVLTDDQTRLLDKSTLMPDTIIPYLTGDPYTGNASYPKPDIEGYKSEFLTQGFNLWRKNPYGSNWQQTIYFIQISGGTMYSAILSNQSTTNFYPKNKSPYTDGYLSDYCFFEDMTPTEAGTLENAGYSLGSLIVFDKVNGRFAAGTAYGGISTIDTKYLKAFPGHTMVYGSATNIANNAFVAVLEDGDSYKMLLINTGKDDEGKNNVRKLVAESNCSGVINSKTKFYTANTTSTIFFVTDDKLYRYNLLDLQGGGAPNENHVIAKLSDFGYNSDAVITDICMSRSENTILLGVSRYGSDTEATGEEAKGDLLYFDYNKATLEIKYVPEKSHNGIAGIPVDIEIKYQTHWRDGKDAAGNLIDNI